MLSFQCDEVKLILLCHLAEKEWFTFCQRILLTTPFRTIITELNANIHTEFAIDALFFIDKPIQMCYYISI